QRPRRGNLEAFAEAAQRHRSRASPDLAVDHERGAAGRHMPHAEVPFRWCEMVPRLLEKGATEQLITIAQQAEADLEHEHGLPLGAITLDPIPACAGYSPRGDENDNAVAPAMTLVLQTIAQTMRCFVLAVAHLSDTGIRGGKSKEEIADVIWACLSDHEFGT